MNGQTGNDLISEVDERIAGDDKDVVLEYLTERKREFLKLEENFQNREKQFKSLCELPIKELVEMAKRHYGRH